MRPTHRIIFGLNISPHSTTKQRIIVIIPTLKLLILRRRNPRILRFRYWIPKRSCFPPEGSPLTHPITGDSMRPGTRVPIDKPCYKLRAFSHPVRIGQLITQRQTKPRTSSPDSVLMRQNCPTHGFFSFSKKVAAAVPYRIHTGRYHRSLPGILQLHIRVRGNILIQQLIPRRIKPIHNIITTPPPPQTPPTPEQTPQQEKPNTTKPPKIELKVEVKYLSIPVARDDAGVYRHINRIA